MPPSLFKKSALTSSGWSDRYPEVNTKPFRLEAFFSKDTQVNTMDMKETLQGLGWKLQNSVTSQKKSPDLWATDVCTCVHVLRYKSNHSFSFPSRKLWIFWKFSSCWPRASSKMPMGDLFSPAPSILFSSLFFMLRRRNEACAHITEKADGKVTVNILNVWQKQTYKLQVTL